MTCKNCQEHPDEWHECSCELQIHPSGFVVEILNGVDLVRFDLEPSTCHKGIDFSEADLSRLSDPWWPYR